MSPLIERSRAGARPDPTYQPWFMLLFESLGGGIMAVTCGLVAVMMVVGVYVIVVWPLTFWDLTGLGLERYSQWTNTVLWSVFGGGTAAGFWVFSGAAFKKPKKKPTSAPTRTRR
jgi:hypothetical protein